MHPAIQMQWWPSIGRDDACPDDVKRRAVRALMGELSAERQALEALTLLLKKMPLCRYCKTPARTRLGEEISRAHLEEKRFLGNLRTSKNADHLRLRASRITSCTDGTTPAAETGERCSNKEPAKAFAAEHANNLRHMRTQAPK